MSEQTHNKLVLKKVEGAKPGKVYYPLEVQSTPTPRPSGTQLLCRPTHVALNHRDLFLRQHLYPAPSFETPLLSCGVADVLSPANGPSRVLLTPGHGWLSSPSAPEGKYAILGGTSLNPLGTAQDLLVVEKSETVACPAHLTGPEAAALPLTGLTGWRALVTKSGAAEAGNNILITGIGGGVALCVLQFAVAMGVNVWVSSGNQEKLEKAAVLGAKGGINYKTAGWEKELKTLMPRDRPYLDAVIDGAGGDIVTKVLRVLKPGGVVVSYGMTTGPMLPVPMGAVLNHVEIRGSTMGSRQEFRDMVAFVAEKEIHPVVSRVVKGKLGDLQKWDDLFEDMKQAKQFGKLVYELEQNNGGSKL